jgi:hypothetical protein
VIVPALWVLGRSARPLCLIGVGVASVAVWLVPMILDTGFWTLVDVAWGQTTGHFTEFGGTVQTESDLGRRVAGLVQGLWADGMGGWWPGRHPVTAVSSAGVLGLGAVGAWQLGQGWRGRRRAVGLVMLCAFLYGLWIFLGQNVVHKSRHVLPLLPLLLLLPAAGATVLWRRGRWGIRAGILGAAGAYAAVAVVIAVQHMSPSAIAQAKQFVEAQTERPGPTRVASVPLLNTYLRAQQVEARYLSIEDSTDMRRLRRVEAGHRPEAMSGRSPETTSDLRSGRTLVVGTYASLLEVRPDSVRRFYHNPHVNRMWPEVTVYVYEH